VPPALGFRLKNYQVHWEGPVDISPDELHDFRPGEAAKRRRDRAAEWLKARLAAGPRPATDLITAAIKAGYPERTLNRAKVESGVRAKAIDRPNRPRSWFWFDPESSGDNPPIESFPPEPVEDQPASAG
jgi:hypothetical protein